MIGIRLIVLSFVFISWGQFLSIKILPDGLLSGQLALGIIISALCCIAWIFGAWFIFLGVLHGGHKEAKVVSVLIPIAPLYIVGIPLVGLDVLSLEIIFLSVMSFLANYRPTELYGVVWRFKRGWREKIPDDGSVSHSEYRRIYLNIMFIYVAFPLISWIVLPVLFRGNG